MDNDIIQSKIFKRLLIYIDNIFGGMENEIEYYKKQSQEYEKKYAELLVHKINSSFTHDTQMMDAFIKLIPGLTTHIASKIKKMKSLKEVHKFIDNFEKSNKHKGIDMDQGESK